MTVARTVAPVVTDHVIFEVECIGLEHGEMLAYTSPRTTTERNELPTLSADRSLQGESVRVEGLRVVPPCRVVVDGMDRIQVQCRSPLIIVKPNSA